MNIRKESSFDQSPSPRLHNFRDNDPCWTDSLTVETGGAEEELVRDLLGNWVRGTCVSGCEDVGSFASWFAQRLIHFG
jgi:hypothetical protein